MPKRHNNTGRSTTERFVSVPYYMLRSEAWRSLSPIAVKILLHVMSLYNGANNGRLALSARTAAEVAHCSKDTGARAIRELICKGFLELSTPGGFSRKTPHAAEYRLTLHPCHCTNARPSKAFMRWIAEPQSRTRSDYRDSQSDQKDSSAHRATKLPGSVPHIGPRGPF